MRLGTSICLLTLTTCLSATSFGQSLAVAANCVGGANQDQLLSVIFDTSSRRLTAYSKSTADSYEYATWVSAPLLSPPRLNDMQNAVTLTNTNNQTIRAQFSSKQTVTILGPSGKLSYFCQAYFPSQIGMRD